MDFHSLSRKELQTLCKKNKIPANLTNVAMVNALSSLESVDGIEEFLNRLELESPRTRGRTATRRNPVKQQPESSQPLTRTRRATARKAAEETGQENKDVNLPPQTPSMPITRRRAQAASTRRKLDIADEEKAEVKHGDEQSTQKKKAASTAVKKGYSTRGSVRILENSMAELQLTEPIKMDGETLEEEPKEKIDVDEEESGSSASASKSTEEDGAAVAEVAMNEYLKGEEHEDIVAELEEGNGDCHDDEKVENGLEKDYEKVEEADDEKDYGDENVLQGENKSVENESAMEEAHESVVVENESFVEEVDENEVAKNESSKVGEEKEVVKNGSFMEEAHESVVLENESFVDDVDENEVAKNESSKVGDEKEVVKKGSFMEEGDEIEFSKNESFMEEGDEIEFSKNESLEEGDEKEAVKTESSMEELHEKEVITNESFIEELDDNSVEVVKNKSFMEEGDVFEFTKNESSEEGDEKEAAKTESSNSVKVVKNKSFMEEGDEFELAKNERSEEGDEKKAAKTESSIEGGEIEFAENKSSEEGDEKEAVKTEKEAVKTERKMEELDEKEIFKNESSMEELDDNSVAEVHEVEVVPLNDNLKEVQEVKNESSVEVVDEKKDAKYDSSLVESDENDEAVKDDIFVEEAREKVVKENFMEATDEKRNNDEDMGDEGSENVTQNDSEVPMKEDVKNDNSMEEADEKCDGSVCGLEIDYDGKPGNVVDLVLSESYLKQKQDLVGQVVVQENNEYEDAASAEEGSLLANNSMSSSPAENSTTHTDEIENEILIDVEVTELEVFSVEAHNKSRTSPELSKTNESSPLYDVHVTPEVEFAGGNLELPPPPNTALVTPKMDLMSPHLSPFTKGFAASPLAADQLPQLSCQKSSAKRESTLRRTTFVSDNKENPDKSDKVEQNVDKEKKNKEITKENTVSLDDKSLRQLTKMLKEKLTLKNSKKDISQAGKAARPALQVLPSDNIAVKETETN